jgi:hypothetical protein
MVQMTGLLVGLSLTLVLRFMVQQQIRLEMATPYQGSGYFFTGNAKDYLQSLASSSPTEKSHIPKDFELKEREIKPTIFDDKPLPKDIYPNDNAWYY